MRILITRPANLAASLNQQLIMQGDTPVLFPTIQIVPTLNKNAINNQIRQIPLNSLLIFSSKAAVQYGMEALNQHWSSHLTNSFTNPLTSPSAWQFAAIGQGTASMMQEYGIKNVICPESPPFESEHLLSLKEFQNVKNQPIAIFRGNGGRSLLPDTLHKRGAKIQIIECYQRILPNLKNDYTVADFNINPIDVIITTSLDALKNLILLIGSKGLTMIRDIPMVVVSTRSVKEAEQLSIRHIVLAKGANDHCLIEAVNNIRKQK